MMSTTRAEQYSVRNLHSWFRFSCCHCDKLYPVSQWLAGQVQSVKLPTLLVVRFLGTDSGDETTEILAVSVMSCSGGALAGDVYRMQSVYKIIFIASFLYGTGLLTQPSMMLRFSLLLTRVVNPCCQA